jgi:hypothetical protein
MKKYQKVKRNKCKNNKKNNTNRQKIPGFCIDKEIIEAYNNEPDFY